MKTSTGSAQPFGDWEFWYEQCPIGRARGIYKFDREALQDGLWHQLRKGSDAVYRCLGDYFCFCSPQNQEARDHLGDVLAWIEQCGLLGTDDELEILIRAGQSGAEMTSHWLFLGDAAQIADASPASWNEAYQRLKELE